MFLGLTCFLVEFVQETCYSCKNIQKVFVSYMDTNERPDKYKREQQKLPTAEKVVKTTKKPSNGKPASRRSFTPCPMKE